MLMLAASLLPLLLGPLLAAALQRVRGAARLIDAFVLFSVAGLVVFHVFPVAFASAGALAVVAAVAGAALPMLGGKIFSAKPGSVRTASLAIAMVGLAVHAVVDGVALSPHTHGHAHAGSVSLMALAVVLHRIPVGLAIWWLVRARLGTRVAVAVIAAVSVCTVIGFGAAHSLAGVLHGTAMGMFQALVAGSLLHVAVGHSATSETSSRQTGQWHVASGLGGLAGLATGVALVRLHPLQPLDPTALQVGRAFVTLIRESAPALLIGYLLAAVLHVLLPGRYGAWLRGGSALPLAARGAAAGVRASTCSCGITPLYDGLVRAGIPPAAGLALLVAAPEISVLSVLLSIRLLGYEMALGRVIAAAVIALLVGAWIGTRLLRQRPHARTTEAPAGPAAWPSRVREGLRFGFVHLADQTLPWFAVGILLASLIEPLLDPARIAALPAGADVPLMGLLALPLYVCATGSTPLAAVLVHKGVSPGGAIAFLLAGSATNVATFGILARLHGKKVALAFGVAIGIGAIVAGMIANLVLPESGLVPLHSLDLQPTGALGLASMALLGLILLVSLLRQGAHGFVARVVMLHGHDHHHEPQPQAAHATESRSVHPIVVPEENSI